MRLAVAVILLLACLALGSYYLMWAYQSASFSVAATEPMRAVYQTRAMLAFPLGCTLAVLGVVLFLLIKRPKRDAG